MLARIRAAAVASGPQWLRDQLSGLLPESGQVIATPAPSITRARRSRPPERLSPELTPRGCRRAGSPVMDPSAFAAKRTPSQQASGAGRNPLHRRPPGGRSGSATRSHPPSTASQDHTAAFAGATPAIEQPCGGECVHPVPA